MAFTTLDRWVAPIHRFRAVDRLRAVGFAVTVEQRQDSGEEVGAYLDLQPASGTPLPRGSTVLTVAGG